MEYRKFATAALLCGSIALSLATGGSEKSASASARITLQIPARAEVRQTEDPDTGHLCLSHIPARNYHLSVRDFDSLSSGEQRLPGRAGNYYCVPISASQQGKLVVIVAE